MGLDIGLQVFSIRKSMEEDIWGTLEKVASIGYKYIEFANHKADRDFGVGYGIEAMELKKRMDDLGLKVAASHIGPINDDNLDKIAEYHTALGNKIIIESIGYWSCREEVLAFAESLNRKGKRLRESNIDFCYHNHIMEFQVFEGERVIDTLQKHTDSEYLKFELDLYWAYRSGISKPEELIKELGDRCRLVHLKDIPGTVEEPNIFNIIDKGAVITRDKFMEFGGAENFAEIGDGVIGAERIVKSLSENPGISALIVEQDQSRFDELESVEISYKNLKKIMK